MSSTLKTLQTSMCILITKSVLGFSLGNSGSLFGGWPRFQSDHRMPPSLNFV